MAYDGPLSVLCDAQSIPILLFMGEHGTCTKTAVYREVSHSSTTPKRLESLANSGLIRMETLGNGRTTLVHLTDRGERVMGFLRDIESSLVQEP